MKIETRKLELLPYQIETKGRLKILTSSRSRQEFPVTAIQESYLQQVAQGKSLSSIAMDTINGGQTFSFRELFNLMWNLISLDVVKDPEVFKYFQKVHEEITTCPLPTVKAKAAAVREWKKDSIATLPFFRRFKKDIIETFIQNSEILEVPERTKVVGLGETSRDMFAILEGEASVYGPGLKHREFITTIPAGSVFGEGAFFFNRPRTADVITNMHSVLVRIHFHEQDFQSFLSGQNKTFLEERVWIIHGLLSSPLFKNVPPETMDQFVNIGHLRQVEAGEIIFRQGEPGEGFFVVIQGKVVATHNQRLIHTLKQGDIFGEIALMIDRRDRTATCEVAESGRILEVGKNEFYKVLTQNLILAREIEEIAYKRDREING